MSKWSGLSIKCVIFIPVLHRLHWLCCCMHCADELRHGWSSKMAYIHFTGTKCAGHFPACSDGSRWHGRSVAWPFQHFGFVVALTSTAYNLMDQSYRSVMPVDFYGYSMHDPNVDLWREKKSPCRAWNHSVECKTSGLKLSKGKTKRAVFLGVPENRVCSFLAIEHWSVPPFGCVLWMLCGGVCEWLELQRILAHIITWF